MIYEAMQVERGVWSGMDSIGSGIGGVGDYGVRRVGSRGGMEGASDCVAWVAWKGRVECPYLKLGEFVGTQFLSRHDEPHHMLRQEREGTQVEYFVSVFIHEFQYLWNEEMNG